MNKEGETSNESQTLRLIHELEVQKNELEMQNIELQAQNAKLRIQSEKTELLVNSIVEGVVEVDLDGQILYANRGASQILGISQSDIAGLYFQSKHWNQMDEKGEPFPPEKLPFAVTLREKIIVGPIEYPIANDKGVWKWLSVSSAPLLNQEGSIYGAVATFLDITARRNLEEAISKSEHYFRNCYEDIEIFISVFLLDGTLTYVNATLAKVAGKSAESLIGKNFYSLLGQEEALSTRKDIESLTTEHSVLTRVQKYNSNSGEIYYHAWTIRALFDSSDQLIGYRAIGQDITKRKITEHALLESHSDLLERQNGLDKHAIVALTDLKGKISYANKMFCDVSKYSRKELIGKDHRIINSGFHSKEFWVNLYDTLGRGETWHGEIRNKAKDGSLYWVTTTISPLRNFEGKIEQYMAIRTDITKQKMAEEKIQALLDEKELILVEVHHRIKNNMNTIFSLLKIQANAQEETAQRAILLDAAGRVQSMMVLYDKLYRSELKNALSIKVYLSALVYEILRIFPKSSSVKLNMYIEDIILNSKILSPLGILLNELVTNTLKYSLIGMKNGEITITAIQNENKIILSYSDNGLPMPEEVSLENTKGFGLTLVNMLVKQIKGTIRIERSEGSKFIIEFEN